MHAKVERGRTTLLLMFIIVHYLQLLNTIHSFSVITNYVLERQCNIFNYQFLSAKYNIINLSKYASLTWQCKYTPNYLWPSLIAKYGVVGHNNHNPRVFSQPLHLLVFVWWLTNSTSTLNVVFSVTQYLNLRNAISM